MARIRPTVPHNYYPHREHRSKRGRDPLRWFKRYKGAKRKRYIERGIENETQAQINRAL